MIIVSDTTPIVSLLKLKRLYLLEALYGVVYIPPSVYAELTDNPNFQNEAEIIKHCSYLQQIMVTFDSEVDLFRQKTGLDLGESEAILLAKHIHADLLLIDEALGRSVVKSMGFNITGVIGIIVDAYQKHLLSNYDIRECIEILRNSNRFISEKLYKILLSLIDE